MAYIRCLFVPRGCGIFYHFQLYAYTEEQSSTRYVIALLKYKFSRVAILLWNVLFDLIILLGLSIIKSSMLRYVYILYIVHHTTSPHYPYTYITSYSVNAREVFSTCLSQSQPRPPSACGS